MAWVDELQTAITAWLLEIAASGWVFPALYLLTVADAFLVVLPSETAVTALGAISASSGSPDLALVIGVAWAGAVTGDVSCYLLGRRIGTTRFAWMRRPRVADAIGRAGVALERRAAAAILTARYIPFARIAVNLVAGASGLRPRRYLPITVLAGLAWALWNVGIGAVVGRLLPGRPVLATLVSIVVAVGLGVTVDRISAVLAGRRRRTRASLDELAPRLLADDGVPPAVGEVDDEAERQPDEEPHPGERRQVEHEPDAEHR
jgi:membrane-associated protein